MKILLAMFLFAGIVSAVEPMPEINIEAYFNNETARNTALNYIINNSTNTVWKQDEVITTVLPNKFDLPISTYTNCSYLRVNIRLPFNLLSKRNEIRDTVKAFLINNFNKIERVRIKTHLCYNEKRRESCVPIPVYNRW